VAYKTADVVASYKDRAFGLVEIRVGPALELAELRQKSPFRHVHPKMVISAHGSPLLYESGFTGFFFTSYLVSISYSCTWTSRLQLLDFLCC
jgi:hypothetical protein